METESHHGSGACWLIQLPVDLVLPFVGIRWQCWSRRTLEFGLRGSRRVDTTMEGVVTNLQQQVEVSTASVTVTAGDH